MRLIWPSFHYIPISHLSFSHLIFSVLRSSFIEVSRTSGLYFLSSSSLAVAASRSSGLTLSTAAAFAIPPSSHLWPPTVRTLQFLSSSWFSISCVLVYSAETAWSRRPLFSACSKAFILLQELHERHSIYLSRTGSPQSTSP